MAIEFDEQERVDHAVDGEEAAARCVVSSLVGDCSGVSRDRRDTERRIRLVGVSRSSGGRPQAGEVRQ